MNSNEWVDVDFILFFRTCVGYDYDFVYDVVMSTYLLYNDQYQKMNTYFDRHEMMMMVVVVMLKEETQVVEVVALNMDHRMFDNKMDHCK